MKVSKLMLGSLLAASVVLGGCTTKTASTSQYSGFLSSYEGLSASKTASGNTVLRWVDPSFNVANYDKVIFQPVRFYPEPHTTETSAAAPTTAPEQTLLRALGHDPVGLDALQARCGWPTAQLQAQLMALELMGQVGRLPGGLFQRVSTSS